MGILKESVTGRRGKKLNRRKNHNIKKMTEPTSQMAESKIFLLPYKWQDVMGSLNIGNRSTDFKRNKPTGTILNEDVIEQRILGNGELYTCKLITKKIGNSNTLLRRLGIRFPESTTVV